MNFWFLFLFWAFSPLLFLTFLTFLGGLESCSNPVIFFFSFLVSCRGNCIANHLQSLGMKQTCGITPEHTVIVTWCGCKKLMAMPSNWSRHCVNCVKFFLHLPLVASLLANGCSDFFPSASRSEVSAGGPRGGAEDGWLWMGCWARHCERECCSLPNWWLCSSSLVTVTASL